jgi:hypothetical protein
MQKFQRNLGLAGATQSMQQRHMAVSNILSKVEVHFVQDVSPSLEDP